MKRVSVVLGALLLAASVIGFSAFKSNTFHKNLTVVTQEYALTSQAPADIDAAANWSIATTDPCDHATADICTISYDDQFFTKQQALDLVKNGAPFTDGQVFTSGGHSVTVSTRTN